LTEGRKQTHGSSQQEQTSQTAAPAAVSTLPIANSFLALLVHQEIQSIVFVKDVVMIVVGHGRLFLADEFIQGFPDCGFISFAVLDFPGHEFLTQFL
jgi:hypothetical protein